VLRHLSADYPSCWTFSVDGLVGATPELLVRSEKGLVTSRVLAGTIRRTGDDDADLARAAILAHSSKDLEEHEYAVASLTRALEPFCSSTNVPETPFVLHLPNVLHLATDVNGVLSEHDPHPTSLALAEALHPTAAVAGTPTQAAVLLIEELEQMDRGRYAGPVGWLGADGDGEWGIGLRSAALDPTDRHRLRLFAGCGIVAASSPDAELAESEAKLEPMRHALRSEA
jgi:menaquinone-specific isochorismate synthase